MQANRGREVPLRLAATPDGLPEGYEPPAGLHPGEWHLHHIALPVDRPGNFTPVRKPGYAEEKNSPHGELARYLAVLLLIAGASRRMAEHQAQLEGDLQAEPEA
jgi:hypothetical protein